MSARSPEGQGAVPLLKSERGAAPVESGDGARDEAQAREGRERDSRTPRGEPRPVDLAAMETLLHDVPLEVSVELGRARLPLGELAARLAPGQVIALDTAAGALLDVRVQSRLIARAEAVAIGERCGIRILELVGGNDS